MRAWQIVGDGGIEALERVERPSPEPGPGQVKVRVRANSINYRDLNAVRAPARMGIAFPRIPNSDGAGDVTALGAGVSGIAAGDRVAGCFFQNWTAGEGLGGGDGKRAGRGARRHAGRRGRARGRRRRADPGASGSCRCGDPALRRPHRLARAGREGPPQGRRHRAAARHRRRLGFRAPALHPDGGAGDRHLEERRQARPRPRHGRVAHDQLRRDAGLGGGGQGLHRRCGRGPRRRSRRRRDARAIHRSRAHRRPCRPDRRADPRARSIQRRSCASRSA